MGNIIKERPSPQPLPEWRGVITLKAIIGDSTSSELSTPRPTGRGWGEGLPLRLTQIVVDTGNHLGGEAALMGGVAKLGELLCEVMIEIDPALQLLPGCVWSQGGSVTEGQLCAAVVFAYLFHTTKLLKINELCKFFFEKL